MIHKVRHKIKQKFPRGGFARNAATLMTGTAVAQGISIVLAPVLTRLYSPEEFGLFALYFTIASPLSVIATARYESAIMLPDREEDALNVVALSCSISILLGVVLLFPTYLFRESIAHLMGQEELKNWLYFVPVTVMFTGVYQSLNYLANRYAAYKLLAANRITQSAMVSIINIGMGLLGFGLAGLLVANIFGQVLATVLILISLLRLNKLKLEPIKFKIMIQQAKRYIKFPKYDIPSMFINVVANQVPVFMLGKFFNSAIVGFYSLTNKVIGLPVSLVSGSILDVFRQRASSDYTKYGNCEQIFKKTFKSLLLMSILPFLLFAFFAPFLFSVVFGATWRTAGEYAQIMSVMLLLKFISSPLSYMFFVAEKQEYNFIGQFFLLLFSIGSIFIGVYLHNVKVAILTFSLSYSIVYIGYLMLSYKFSKGVKYAA